MQNKLLAVLNSFVFLTKRSGDCLKTVDTLSTEVQNDFRQAVQKLITESNGWDNKNSPFLSLKREDYKNDESLIVAYHRLLHPQNFHSPAGFTPKLCLYPQIDFMGKKIRGLNCLGRAIALGIFLKRHGYKIMLAIRPSHAVIIVCLSDVMYYCDPQEDHLFRLHGKFRNHGEFYWYETHLKDNLFSKFFVFHEFSSGIINAIFGNLGFLQNSDNYELVDENDHLVNTIRNFVDTTVLDSIDWNRMQEHFCPNMNLYIRKYKVIYLLECERTKLRIYQRDLDKKFDQIAFDAYEIATGEKMMKEKLKKFLEINMPIMQEYGETIIHSFDFCQDFCSDLPDQILQYLMHIRAKIADDVELRDHVVTKMKHRLLSQSVP